MKTEVPLRWTARKHRTVKSPQLYKKQQSKQIRQHGGKVHKQHVNVTVLLFWGWFCLQRKWK